MTLYFAYGANLDAGAMKERCPEARRLGPATLEDHCFTIVSGGYGHAAPATGSRIYGWLWELSPADLAALDAFEGSGYRQEYAEVRAEGGPQRAMLYRARNPARGRPVPGYLEGIIDSARKLGFPAAYVTELERLLADGLILE